MEQRSDRRTQETIYLGPILFIQGGGDDGDIKEVQESGGEPCYVRKEQCPSRADKRTSNLARTGLIEIQMTKFNQLNDYFSTGLDKGGIQVTGFFKVLEGDEQYDVHSITTAKERGEKRPNGGPFTPFLVDPTQNPSKRLGDAPS
ncbi:hypothetical protein SELMODRAFT_414720 [Selaginella moellendorffii]|uniref:Uncharacterized protein n=1 Tax=Selaginella moellendorffii TaxID=88036 RepID=D8RTQ1_SELML|nr:hypothetical protein SELMODRAFT_414720 [Selaginella moellendorffii]